MNEPTSWLIANTPPGVGIRGDESRNLRTIQSVSRALTALTLIGESARGVVQLAGELGMDKSSASRLLATLEEKGFVARQPQSGSYILGAAIGRLGAIYAQRHDSFRQIAPILDELAMSTGETVTLTVFNGTDSVCVDKRESTHNLRTSAQVGRPVPLHAGASGKSVLAQLDETRARELATALGLEPFTERTLTDWDGLRLELAAIRERGYATSFEEIDHGIGGVGVALRDWQGVPTGAVSITAPLLRFTEAHVEGYARLLRRHLDDFPFLPFLGASAPARPEPQEDPR